MENASNAGAGAANTDASSTSSNLKRKRSSTPDINTPHKSKKVDGGTSARISPPPFDTKPFLVKNLPGAEVYYIHNFISDQLASNWHKELDELDTWYHPTLKFYGKTVAQSRSIAAYASSDTVTAKYSGHQVDMHYADDVPQILQTIWDHVMKQINLEFNHVMLNNYANGTEYIGRHRDTKENGVIASLSLGAVRTFVMTPNRNSTNMDAITQKWPLANGSLLIMMGATQDNWKHEIPKEPKVKDGRISLTFRQMPDATIIGGKRSRRKGGA
ncbi:hypothetical protein BKA62DRAFT_710183 [Auriculariales sp. MPI-PUGE-AT-0066]|nr:hypothetical protein BKA62DRAFT_710183 [Auriculariales sp. MPI-PUGE-AT-0066]